MMHFTGGLMAITDVIAIGSSRLSDLLEMTHPQMKLNAVAINIQH